MTVAEATFPNQYPADIQVDPPLPQSRLTVFFRIFLVIPHAIILGLLMYVVTFVSLIAWVAILVTGSYPRGLYGFTAGVFRWYVRYTGYAYLLTDRYPPFSMDQLGDYPIRFAMIEQVDGRNRLTVFFRYILIIPHLIILWLLTYVLMVVLFFAWIMALFTGSVPAGLHQFIEGYMRWLTRVYAYGSLLIDDYPPFSFS